MTSPLIVILSAAKNLASPTIHRFAQDGSNLTQQTLALLAGKTGRIAKLSSRKASNEIVTVSSG